MGKIVRHEFLGSHFVFFGMCVLFIFIPFAVLYLLQRTVTVVEEVESPDEFIRDYRRQMSSPGS